jgi:hypothetical protein
LLPRVSHGAIVDALVPTGLVTSRPGYRPRIGASNLIAGFARASAIATDFPPPANSPQFSWEIDPVLGIPVSEEVDLGPVFLQSARPLREGRASFSMSYIHADFDSLDGKDLDGLHARGLEYAGRPVPLNFGFVFETFRYTVETFLFSVTYGLWRDIDVRLVLPVLYSDIAVRQGFGDGSRQSSVSESAFGPGDLRGEARWMFADGEQWAVGLLTSVRFPTGDEQELQGLGDWSIKPLLLAEYRTNRFRASTNLGFDLNLDDASRTVVVYGVGFAYLVHDQISLNAELLGVSQPVEADLTNNFGELSIDQSRTLAPFNSVRIAPSLKVSLKNGVFLSAGVLVPIVNDGLQADAVPLAGVEWQW